MTLLLCNRLVGKDGKVHRVTDSVHAVRHTSGFITHYETMVSTPETAATTSMQQGLSVRIPALLPCYFRDFFIIFRSAL